VVSWEEKVECGQKFQCLVVVLQFLSLWEVCFDFVEGIRHSRDFKLALFGHALSGFAQDASTNFGPFALAWHHRISTTEVPGSEDGGRRLEIPGSEKPSLPQTKSKGSPFNPSWSLLYMLQS
jgi:hypothetical protein